MPADEYQVTTMVDFGTKILGTQNATLEHISDFKKEKDSILYNTFLNIPITKRDRFLTIHIDCLQGECPKTEKTSSKKSGKVVTTNEEDDASGTGFAPNFLRFIASLLALFGLGFGFELPSTAVILIQFKLNPPAGKPSPKS